jgi:hypothetical protein
MNEMNELETQLRSWAPRRPSARISRVLFGQEALARFRRERELKASHSSAFLLNWLAPAVAAVALVFAFVHLPSSPTHSNRSLAAPAFAVILSNQSLGPILLEASNREPASPASVQRSIGMDGLGTQPKVFGVATSGVSTGASERLPNWQSQPQMEERDNPATNGAGLAPQAGIPKNTGALYAGWRFCGERSTLAAAASRDIQRPLDLSPSASAAVAATEGGYAPHCLKGLAETGRFMDRVRPSQGAAISSCMQPLEYSNTLAQTWIAVPEDLPAWHQRTPNLGSRRAELCQDVLLIGQRSVFFV